MHHPPKAPLEDLRAQYRQQLSEIGPSSVAWQLPQGWLALFRSLCEEIEGMLSSEERRRFYWVQVSERDGQLRAAGHGLRDARRLAVLRAVIARAEAASASICVICGEPTSGSRAPGTLPLCTAHIGQLA